MLEADAAAIMRHPGVPVHNFFMGLQGLLQTLTLMLEDAVLLLSTARMRGGEDRSVAILRIVVMIWRFDRELRSAREAGG
jgi:hypothetical protein